MTDHTQTWRITHNLSTGHTTVTESVDFSAMTRTTTTQRVPSPASTSTVAMDDSETPETTAEWYRANGYKRIG